MAKLAEVMTAMAAMDWPRGSRPGNFRISFFNRETNTEIARFEQPTANVEVSDDDRFRPGLPIEIRVVRLSTDGAEVGPAAICQSVVPALERAEIPQAVSVTFAT